MTKSVLFFSIQKLNIPQPSPPKPRAENINYIYFLQKKYMKSSTIRHTFIPVCSIDIGKQGSGLELSHNLNCLSTSSVEELNLK